MRKYLLTSLAALSLAATVFVSAPHGSDHVDIQPGQALFVDSGGTTSLGRIQNSAITTVTRTQVCEVSRSWNDFNGTARHMSGNVVVRVAWVHDTRGTGSEDDVDYIDWNYNWPGTGSGEGTGISLENNTNYVLRVDNVQYRNIAQGAIANGSYSATFGIAQGQREHVMGEGWIFNTDDWEDWHAHSYWHNAPRVRAYFSSANWDYGYTSQSQCNAYTPGQPSA